MNHNFNRFLTKTKIIYRAFLALLVLTVQAFSQSPNDRFYSDLTVFNTSYQKAFSDIEVITHDNNRDSYPPVSQKTQVFDCDIYKEFKLKFETGDDTSDSYFRNEPIRLFWFASVKPSDDVLEILETIKVYLQHEKTIQEDKTELLQEDQHPLFLEFMIYPYKYLDKQYKRDLGVNFKGKFFAQRNNGDILSEFNFDNQFMIGMAGLSTFSDVYKDCLIKQISLNNCTSWRKALFYYNLHEDKKPLDHLFFRLTSLNLAKNNLIKFDPFGLFRLKKLILTGNRIQSIDFFYQPYLSELFLAHNNLRKLKFGCLNDLDNLTVAVNENLCSIDVLNCPKLKTLWVGITNLQLHKIKKLEGCELIGLGLSLFTVGDAMVVAMRNQNQ